MPTAIARAMAVSAAGLRQADAAHVVRPFLLQQADE